MPVRFIIGRAGSGKSAHCFQSIVAALRDDPLGPPIFWLLPQQATFQAERELTCLSGLGGFCRARVLSFEQLARDLMSECGGIAIPELTPLGRQMILALLLRQHQPSLRFFGQVAHQPGLTSRIDATLSEFERCGKDPTDLEKLLATLDPSRHPGEDPFLDKLHDLHLIYKAYCDYIGQDHLDPRGRMRQVLECVSSSNRLRDATFYVDGFYEFDEFQRRLLAALALRCRAMHITLLIDPDSPVLRPGEKPPADLSLFHRVEWTYRRLFRCILDQHVAVEKPLRLPSIRRFATPALAEIEQALFSDKTGSRGVLPHGILLAEAPDRRAEVEHAARHIRHLLAQGYRLRDIAVLVRSLDSWHDLIHAIFREHNIPHFLDRRRTMAHHPLLQLTRALLAVAQEDWPHEPLMVLIKSGLASLSFAEADRLENYVLLHRIRRSAWTQPEPWAWRGRLAFDDPEPPSPADDPAAMDSLRRRVVEALQPFIARAAGQALPLRTVVLELFHALRRMNVRKTMESWILECRAARQHEQAAEHEQIWTELVELFDQMVDLVGDQPVTLAEFRDLLEAGLETFDLALAPPTVDEVLVGQVDRTRTSSARAVLLLGLNEGEFPRAPRGVSILSDHERLQLQEHAFEVHSGAERRLLDESLLGYVALTRAADQLYLSRSASDEKGRPVPASPFWMRLLELFPSLQPRTLPRELATDPSLIATPRQLLTCLMRWARAISDDAAPSDPAAPWPSLYQWLASHPACDDPLDLLRHRAWRSLAYENAASLNPELARSLFPAPLVASPQQLEEYAACPFKFFARHALRLQWREEEETIAMNLDGALHDILDRICRDLLRRGLSWDQISSDEIIERVDAYLRHTGASVRGAVMLSSARNRYLVTRLRRSLEQVLAFQRAAQRRGQFRTALPAFAFSPESGQPQPLVIDTPAGRQLHLVCRVDRVDVVDDHAAVFDYRSGQCELNLGRVCHGLSLRLPASLLAVKDRSPELLGRQLRPAGAFNVRLLRQLESVPHPDKVAEESQECFALRGKQRGVFDSQFLQKFDRDCGADSKLVAARLCKDGSFGYFNSTDIADTAQLEALLAFTRQRLAELADGILDGKIDLLPFRLGTQTPCPSCAYRALCRFEPAINRYRHLGSMSREEAFQLAKGAAHAS